MTVYHRVFGGGYLFYKDEDQRSVPRPVQPEMDFFEPVEGVDDPRVCMTSAIPGILAEEKLLVARVVRVEIQDTYNVLGPDAIRHFDFALMLGNDELWRAGTYILHAVRDGRTLWTREVFFDGYEAINIGPIKGEGPLRMIVRPDDFMLEKLRSLETEADGSGTRLFLVSVLLDCATDVRD
jgi:hypothetical protein